jgi:hypothetical protein
VSPLAVGPLTVLVTAAGCDPVAVTAVAVPGRSTDLGPLVLTGDSWCEAEIQAASITTDNDQRDEHLRSPDFLDVERFPVLTYRSTGVTSRSPDSWSVTGDLTIRDITRPVPLDVRFAGLGADAWGGTRAAFEARAMLARRDYELRWNLGLPGGLTMVGPSLRIDLDAQVVLQSEAS